MNDEYEAEMRLQHEAPHMRGPWCVEETFGGSRRNEIRVMFYSEKVAITIATWDMAGMSRGSPAYFLIRSHAELLAAAPSLLAMCEDSGAPKSVQIHAAIAKAEPSSNP